MESNSQERHREVRSVSLAKPAASIRPTQTSTHASGLYAALFALVFLDSLLAYLFANFVGLQPPVNASIPVACVLVGLRLGFKAFIPDLITIGGLFALVSAFVIGVVFGDIYGWERLLTIGGLLAAFLVGHAAGRSIDCAETLARLFVMVCGAYALVCVVALLKLVPEVLPIINAMGYRDGELILRPEVTIDQNFQIFYLFPIALLFFLPTHWIRTPVIALVTLAAAFVLVRLYTRSGVILLISALAFSWITPLVYPHYGRNKLWLLPLICAPLAIWQADWIIGVTTEIVFRFTDSDSYRTFYGRVYSAQYLFERVLDADFWIPQGNAEFLRLTGSIPHFNPTALYLEAGLLGLLAWVVLVAWPLARLSWLYVIRGLNSSAIIFLGGGAIVFGAQLSLNAPLYEQVWLWAGAVVGTLNRSLPARAN